MTNITDFLNSENCTLAVSAALDAAIKGDRVLFFPPGEYHFYPEGCFQRQCFFSNNEDSVKNIAILLDGVDDFTISGEGARFMFHGRISPLCAFNCRNLKVSGVTVDFEDSFVSDADLICRENGVAEAYNREHSPKRKIQRCRASTEELHCGFPSEKDEDQRG